MTEIQIVQTMPASEVVDSFQKNSRVSDAIMMLAGSPVNIKGDPDTALLELPWKFTEEFFLDNPDGVVLWKKISSMMLIQAMCDVEDLLLNGDVESSDSLLVACDGLIKRVARTDVDDDASLADRLTVLTDQVTGDSGDYVILVSPSTELDYIQVLAAQVGDEADRALINSVDIPMHEGVQLLPSAFFPDDVAVLFRPADFQVIVGDFVPGEQKYVVPDIEDPNVAETPGHAEGRQFGEYRTSALLNLQIAFDPAHASSVSLNG